MQEYIEKNRDRFLNELLDLLGDTICKRRFEVQTDMLKGCGICAWPYCGSRRGQG